jgi:glycine oxidase
VIVVGAGIIGLAIADALASRGVDVTVLDMRGPGRGASQASAGLLAPFIEADETSALLPLAIESLDRYDAFVADVALRSGRPVEYARTGTLDVALDDNHADRLRASLGTLDRRAVAARWIDPSSLHAFEPAVTPSAVGGLFIESHGFVGVASLMQALVQAARLGGAVFEQPVEAIRIDHVNARADGVEIRSASRSDRADFVVVAAGSWSSSIKIPGATMPVVRPVRGQLVHLKWQGALPARPIWGEACYTVPWSDGSLLVGATVEDVGFDERSTVEGVEQLLTAVRHLLPAAAHASIQDVRVGLRPAGMNAVPEIGALPSAPRVIVATGHFRNGVLLAPLTADRVVTAILG